MRKGHKGDLVAAIGATEADPKPKVKKAKTTKAKTGKGKTADFAESVENDSGEDE